MGFSTFFNRFRFYYDVLQHMESSQDAACASFSGLMIHSQTKGRSGGSWPGLRLSGQCLSCIVLNLDSLIMIQFS
jgi:hypothetical protein